MTHHLPCKFCGLQLTVESDHECPDEWVNVLLRFVACNRCADYRSGMNRWTRAIRSLCLDYIQKHNAKESTPETLEKTRHILSHLTKLVASAVCRFYGTVVIWEPDFVQQLIDRPEKSDAIIATYARMIRQSKG